VAVEPLSPAFCPNALGLEPSTPIVTVEIPALGPSSGWVVEVQDEAGSRRVALAQQAVMVGSGSAADVVVHDPTVSARHCSLTVMGGVAGGGVFIEDLGSRNGTYIGGARIREARGQAGTVVAVGRSTLLLSATGEDDSSDPPGEPLPGIAGSSIVMRRLADQVRRLARHSLPVLIAGESGTGKELVARALHAEGPRRARPFVALNVTAVPRELVESELFGHERGAFTGAHIRREGAFADAQSGTLFLDEIGDLPLEAQPKILRALDGYEVRRVGGAGGGRRADARVVAATHARLEQRVARGEFRRDLYHRLECFVISVPPLRERRGDIGAIAREILGHLASDVGDMTLTSAALARLAAHNWPGNVRELRNVLCRAAVGREPANKPVGREPANKPVAREPANNAVGREPANNAVGREPANEPANETVRREPSGRTTRIDAHDIDLALRRDRLELAKCMTPARAREILRESAGNLSAAARAAGLPRTSFRKLLASSAG
jgi:DNA-binding NtrC family response regulator